MPILSTNFKCADHEKVHRNNHRVACPVYGAGARPATVSYTHLDVYKRQGLGGTQSAVYATEVSAEEYLAYTTEETEKVEVYRLAEKLGDDIEAAIRQLAERRRNTE